MTATTHAPAPTAFRAACCGQPASATCITCGGRLVWRFGVPDTRTATPRGAYEHAEVTR